MVLRQPFVSTLSQTVKDRKFHRPYLATEEVSSMRLPDFIREKLKALQVIFLKQNISFTKSTKGTLSLNFTSFCSLKSWKLLCEIQKTALHCYRHVFQVQHSRKLSKKWLNIILTKAGNCFGLLYVC